MRRPNDLQGHPQGHEGVDFGPIFGPMNVEEFTASKSSTPTLVFSATIRLNGENRPTLKVIPVKIAEQKIARMPIMCRPPRPSFLALSPFCHNLHINLYTYLLLYWVPIPQISAIRRPIVTTFHGRNQNLFICYWPQNDQNQELFRGNSGPINENPFSKEVDFREFLYFFSSI